MAQATISARMDRCEKISPAVVSVVRLRPNQALARMLVTAMAMPQPAMTRPVAMRPIARQYDWTGLPRGVAGVATPWCGGMIFPSMAGGGWPPLSETVGIVGRPAPYSPVKA